MSFGRITNLMVSQQILGEINSSQNTLDTTEEELSTGLSINQPSDNPYGAALAVQLNGQLGDLTNYSDNVSDGTAWTGAASTALQSIQAEAQRAQELVTEAGNGSESASDLTSIGDEINQIVSSIKSTADTQYNGQYIFSGTSTTTQPYTPDTGTTATSDTYAGNSGSVTRTIGPGGASATVNADLGSVLGNGIVNGTSDGGLLGTLRTIANQLTSDSGTSALNGTDLTTLSTNLNQLTQLATKVGATQSQLSMASSTISDLQTSVTSELSSDQDANYASTMTAYTSESASFTAALKAGASIVQTSLMDFLSSN